MTAYAAGTPVEPREPLVPPPPDRPGERAGRLLAVATVAPAAAILAALAACWPLLALGAFRPWPAAVVGLPAGGLAGWATGRGAARRAAPARRRTCAAVFALVVVFGVLAAGWASQDVVLRRDPGAYANTAHWIAEHGSRHVPVDWAAFGGRDDALAAGSPAYYPAGDQVVPQFFSGAPMAFAAGEWVGGVRALLLVPALLGALGLLAFAGLVWRLLGEACAVAATALLGLAYPVLHAARSTYSEPLALLALVGGLALLVDASWPRPAGPNRSAPLALAAGGVLGAATLVRVEAFREVALLIPVAVLLALGQRHVGGRRMGGAFALGLAAGSALGAADGLVLAYPYLQDIRDSVVPLAGLLALLAVGGVLVVLLDGRRRLPRLPARAAGLLAPAAVLLIAAGLAVRPWVSPGRQPATSLGGRAVRGMQILEHLPVDPTRTYAEQTPEWVAWAVGWPALVLAVAGAAWLARRAVLRCHRALPAAGPVLFVLLGSAVLVLLRPGITPDHPWADRRLVPSVLPVVVLAAVAGAAGLVRLARSAWPRGSRGALGGAGHVGVVGRFAPATAATVCGVALLLPPGLATAPLVPVRTQAGELAAVRQVCDRLHPGDVAFLLDLRARREWSAPLRGFCHVPAVGVLDRTALPRLLARARAAGSTPVLVATSYPSRISDAGKTPVHVVHLLTYEDARLLHRVPDRPARLYVDVWLGRA